MMKPIALSEPQSKQESMRTLVQHPRESAAHAVAGKKCGLSNEGQIVEARWNVGWIVPTDDQGGQSFMSKMIQ
jgi:hypothetical protein